MEGLSKWTMVALMVGLVISWCCCGLGEGFKHQPAYTCTCTPQHPQTHVCESDFAIIAKVRKLIPLPESNSNENILWPERQYKIKVKKILKMTKAYNRVPRTIVWTAPDDGTCGVSLNTSTKYILAGAVVKGKAYLTSCSYVAEWYSLTPKQQKGFKRLYSQGCGCKINPCPWYLDGSCHASENICQWTTTLQGPDCQGALSVCLRHPGGGCDWSRNHAYTHCMQQRASTDRLVRRRPVS